MFKVLEVDFVVADNLIEFLTDHEVENGLSFVAGNDVDHGIANFEDFLKVGEDFVGFGGFDEFVVDHVLFDDIDGGFDVLIVGDLGFEPLIEDVHAVFGIFFLLDKVFGLDYKRYTLRAVERKLLELMSFIWFWG